MDLEAIKDKRLLICTPAYSGWVHINYATSLLRTQSYMERFGLRAAAQFLAGCARLAMARNELTRLFMASDADYMLMVDADIGWEQDAPLKLMMHDLPFVAGTTVKRGTDLNCFRGTGMNIDRFRHDDKRGLIKAGAVGTGFIMLRRDMILKMQRAYPNLRLEDESSGDPAYALFAEMLTPEGSDEGEDYSFCNRWTAIGGEIWIDPWLVLSHVTESTHVGILGEEMKLQRPAQMELVVPEAAE